MATSPRTGDLFARDGNDKIWALIISPERKTRDGWLCYAMLMYPDGRLLVARMVVIVPTDRHICRDFPMDYGSQFAFVRRQQIRGALS